MDANQQNGYPPRREVARLSTFELGGYIFGLDILKSREVIPMPGYTPLPNSSEIFYGVFNRRGEIFPLVDISPILGLPPKQSSPEDMVILIELSADFVLGVLVDRPHGVIPYSPSEIKYVKGSAGKEMVQFTKGVIATDDQLVHVLDLDSIFSTKEILAHY